MMVTFQTRLSLDLASDALLSSYASLFGRVIRTLFAKTCAGHRLNDLKTPFLKEFGITARQFNACRVGLEGKISSAKELNKKRISGLADTLAFLEKKIRLIKDKRRRHQKKRRLFILQTRLKNLQNREEKVSLCFGSKKRFRSQFALTENNFSSHEEWKAAWQKARESEIFILGSKDETAGNQSCVAAQNGDGTLNLRLRLPHTLSTFGKYLVLSNLRFAYGHQEILTALENRKAISYRFKKDRKGWLLFATVERSLPPLASDQKKGAIGLDLNAAHVALVETDRFGNPLFKKTIPLLTYGKDRNQTLALMGDLFVKLTAYALKVQKPLVIENLDFQKKKRELRESSSKQARMLSGFAYSAFHHNLSSKAARQGVELKTVNPAFTSVIGRVNYSHRYGLSIHHGAALCIARRSYGFSERPPRFPGKIPDGKGGHVALSLPARNRGKHVWSRWRALSKRLRAAHAERFRAKRNRSGDPPIAGSRDGKPSEVAGAIPARESLAALLG